MGFNFLNCGDHFCLRPSVALVIDFGSESHIEGKSPHLLPYKLWSQGSSVPASLIWSLVVHYSLGFIAYKAASGGWIFFFFLEDGEQDLKVLFYKRFFLIGIFYKKIEYITKPPNYLSSWGSTKKFLDA